MVVGPGLLLPLCGGTALPRTPFPSWPLPQAPAQWSHGRGFGSREQPREEVSIRTSPGDTVARQPDPVLCCHRPVLFSAGQRPRREPQPKTQTSGVGAEHTGVWEEALGSACGLNI